MQPPKRAPSEGPREIAKGVAYLTGQTGTVEQLQLDELIRKDPDYDEAVANIARQEATLARNKEAKKSREDRVLEINREIEKIREAGLGVEQRRIKLLERARDIEKERATAIEAGDKVTAAEKELELVKAQRDIKRMDEQIARASTPKTAAQTIRAQVDSLQRIGGFRGEAPRSEITRQTSELRNIAKELQLLRQENGRDNREIAKAVGDALG